MNRYIVNSIINKRLLTKNIKIIKKYSISKNISMKSVSRNIIGQKSRLPRERLENIRILRTTGSYDLSSWKFHPMTIYTFSYRCISESTQNIKKQYLNPIELKDIIDIHHKFSSIRDQLNYFSSQSKVSLAEWESIDEKISSELLLHSQSLQPIHTIELSRFRKDINYYGNDNNEQNTKLKDTSGIYDDIMKNLLSISHSMINHSYRLHVNPSKLKTLSRILDLILLDRLLTKTTDGNTATSKSSSSYNHQNLVVQGILPNISINSPFNLESFEQSIHMLGLFYEFLATQYSVNKLSIQTTIHDVNNVSNGDGNGDSNDENYSKDNLTLFHHEKRRNRLSRIRTALANTTLALFQQYETFLSSRIENMSSSSSLLPLSSYRYIWLHFPKLELESSYTLSKYLYQHILQSIDIEYLDTAHYFTAKDILSLIECMKESQFRYNRLIHKLCQIISERRYTGNLILVQVVDLLVFIKAPDESIELIKPSLSLSPTKYISRQNKLKFRAGQMSTYDKNSTQITLALRIKLQYQSSPISASMIINDLILALQVFYHDIHTNKSINHLITSLESVILERNISMDLTKAITCLEWYSVAGRKNRRMLAMIDTVLENSYVSVLKSVPIISSLAQLYHLPTKPYIENMAQRFIKALVSGKLKQDKQYTVIAATRILWSLAVLQKLEYEDFIRCETIVLKQIEDRTNDLSISSISNHQSTGYHLATQLSYTLFEMRLKYFSAIEDDRSRHLSVKRSYELFTENRFNQSINRPASSYIHNEISSLLKNMGLYHENEKLLHGLYFVDVFLPINLHSVKSNYIQIFNKHYKKSIITEGTFTPGIVIEVNGLSHYDCYAKEPLGTTVLKRRQLEGFGNPVVSIPYYEYNTLRTQDEKLNYLRNILSKYIDV